MGLSEQGIRVRKGRMCLGHRIRASPHRLKLLEVRACGPPYQAGGFLRTRAQLLPHIVSTALPQGDWPGGREGLTRRACGTSATCGREAWTAVSAEALLHSTALRLSSGENGELCPPRPRRAPPRPLHAPPAPPSVAPGSYKDRRFCL